jgi:predicted O-methyltransferase YrrM
LARFGEVILYNKMGLVKKLKRFVATWPIRGFKNIEGWLSDNEALALYKLARSLPAAATIVEIGSWQGKSTYCLARGLRSGTIHAIDPFDSSGETGSDVLYAQKAAALNKSLLDVFKANLRKANLLQKIEIHKGFSSKFVGIFSEVDFLFIDGDHSIAGCSFDFQEFSPAVRIGGLLAFHDYQPGRSDLGSTFVIDNVVRPSGFWSEVLSADSLLVFRRNDGKSNNF